MFNQNRHPQSILKFLKHLILYYCVPYQKSLINVISLWPHLHRLSDEPQVILATSFLSNPWKGLTFWKISLQHPQFSYPRPTISYSSNHVRKAALLADIL